MICMHILEKQTLVFLIHAHFAVTTVLSNGLTNHFFQQNKLTITFNKILKISIRFGATHKRDGCADGRTPGDGIYRAYA